MKKALIIVDMLNDFVDGVLNNQENVDGIIPGLQKLIAHARASSDWVIVYSNDAHLEGDREFEVWGPHALAGTHGAQVIDAIKPQPVPHKEWESPKRFYSAFDGTGLNDQLKWLGVTEVYVTGQHTNCCVRHTTYDAFKFDYKIFIPSDAVTVPAGGNQEDALGYLQVIYKAAITSSDEICG